MKNAKRILSVIICVILSLGIFAACGKNGNDIDKSITAAPETTAIKQVNDFEEANFDISRALAMGMRFFDDPTYLDNASVMWNTLGWYCCRQKSTGGNEYLTRTQIDAIQHALRPGASAIAAPENWIKGGSLEVKEADGEVFRAVKIDGLDYLSDPLVQTVGIYEVTVSEYVVHTERIPSVDVGGNESGKK